MTTLQGLRIVELAGIGPAPFCGMMLADHGAEVIRIDRPNPGIEGMIPREKDVLSRGRKSIIVDLKTPEGIETVRDLSKTADGLIEGLRPGVMERIGLGPDVLLTDNPRLVYGRVTGWGQTGPLAKVAGHDINYISLSGNLHTYGRAGDKPTPPVNLAADYAGGAMFLAFGMLAAILSAKQSGKGQVIDCAMIDGAAALAGMTWSCHNAGIWSDERGTNLLDTGAHFYDTYETADGKWISIGCIEPQFYAGFRQLAGLEEDGDFDAQLDEKAWPALKEKLTAVFQGKTRSEWCVLLEGMDVCFAPVLSMAEAPAHPHNQERQIFLDVAGDPQPAPAPRFSATPAERPTAALPAGSDAHAVLDSLGYNAEKIDQLLQAGIVRKA